MANDDNFDDIVNNLGDAENDEDDFDQMMDVVENYWKAFHPGEMFVKGVLIVESVTPDGRSLRFETSRPSSDWEVLGMIESVKQQLQASNFVERLIGDDDDEDDDDDE